VIEFLDGPAVVADDLALFDAPEWLRVVQATDGTWDALDAPDDTPRASERIHVYRREGAAGRMFMDYTTKGGRRRGESWSRASYRWCLHQPPDAVARDADAWAAWCASDGAVAALPVGAQQDLFG